MDFVSDFVNYCKQQLENLGIVVDSSWERTKIAANLFRIQKGFEIFNNTRFSTHYSDVFKKKTNSFSEQEKESIAEIERRLNVGEDIIPFLRKMILEHFKN